jgi:hypothetical protein
MYILHDTTRTIHDRECAHQIEGAERGRVITINNFGSKSARQNSVKRDKLLPTTSMNFVRKYDM